MSLVKTADQLREEIAAAGGDTAPNTDELWQSEDVTIEAAMRHACPRVVKAATRARAALQDIRREIAEWEAAAELRAAQARQRALAEAELEAAQRAVEEAKAKLRAAGGRPAAPKKAAAPTRMSSDAAKVARRAGILRSVHAKGHHDAAPNPDCPTCTS